MPRGNVRALLAVPLGLTLAVVGADAMSLDADAVWHLPAAGNANHAALLALDDLKRDWGAVFARPPNVVVGRPTAKFTSPRIVMGAYSAVASAVSPNALRSALDAANVPAFDAQRHPEQHACVVVDDKDLCCLAADGDSLGLVYAIYAVASAVLNLPPHRTWLEIPVEHKRARGGVITLPQAWQHVRNVPRTRYRGFFINDEDLLGGFAKDPLGGAVFSSEAWDRLFQHILRLHGNTVIVGTAGFPDESSFELATRRGLYLAQHHITVLGANLFQWPAGVPYSYAHSPEVQVEVWRSVIHQQHREGREVLWTVGYRGLNDYPFWKDDPEFVTDEQRGELISNVIAAQAAAVGAIAGENATLFSYMWAEMADLFAKGVLHFPPNVTVIHTDYRGSGLVPSASELSAGDGLYYHVAMESGLGNQLTEMVPLRRIVRELRKLLSRNATSAIVLNTSDLRPVLLGTRFVMDWAWEPADAAVLAEDVERAFLQKWRLETGAHCLQFWSGAQAIRDPCNDACGTRTERRLTLIILILPKLFIVTTPGDPSSSRLRWVPRP